MQDFKKLAVWKKAHEFTLAVYGFSASFPRDEVYGLTSQLRRSASSVAANIAEGCGREGQAELARYLQIAMGSASEAEYHLLLARDLGYIAESDHTAAAASIAEFKRMLTGLSQRVRVGRKASDWQPPHNT